jgi:hypothetical protein
VRVDMGIKKLQVPQMCGVARIAASTRGPSSPPQTIVKVDGIGPDGICI